jgi:hypothetical protein
MPPQQGQCLPDVFDGPFGFCSHGTPIRWGRYNGPDLTPQRRRQCSELKNNLDQFLASFSCRKILPQELYSKRKHRDSAALTMSTENLGGDDPSSEDFARLTFVRIVLTILFGGLLMVLFRAVTQDRPILERPRKRRPLLTVEEAVRWRPEF